MNKKEIKSKAIEDLKRSGLDEADYRKMKLLPCDEDEAEAVLGSSFATFGYVMPYFDINNKPIESIRFKFLEELRNQSNKVVKYSQPKGSEPKLYFPPCIKWAKLLKDSSIPITFTEGEKKAYKACKEGIPTIGLGGVWSFKSKRLRKPLIDDFKNIELPGRKILLCFDNDSRSNEDVMRALRAFAKELSNHGAEVFSKNLPFNPYQKIGLDDYLLEHSKDDYNEIPEEPFDELTEIDELNEEVAYIKEVGKFYIFKDNLFVNDKSLTNIKYANRTMMGENGNPVSIASNWVRSPNRREHKRLTYKPGEPEVTDENEYNMWKGWGCIPKQGSIKLFLDAVNKLFNGDEKAITWFLDWIAYPVQNPGAKMLTGVLLQSVEQGTGKSSIGLCIGSMYGDNYKLIDDAQLHGSFNEWAINKQFVLGDEISGKDKRGDSDRIKNLITRPDITINKKYSPTYNVPDCINYLFTSNHPDALNIEPDDRRFFVYQIKSGQGLTLNQGQALEQFRKGEGKSYLLNYFANEHKISKGFDHRARPPMTKAKADLIDHSLTDIERFLMNIRENPEFALTIDGAPIDRDLFTTNQIISMYNRRNPKIVVTETAMGKALKKIFNNEIHVVKTKTAGTQRLRVLRNFSKWEKSNHKDMQEHYDRSKIALFEAKKRKHGKAGAKK